MLAGCGDKAKDLYDTALLEEKQFKKPHATTLSADRRGISGLAFRESGFLDWIESIDVALTMPIKKGA